MTYVPAAPGFGALAVRYTLTGTPLSATGPQAAPSTGIFSGVAADPFGGRIFVGYQNGTSTHDYGSGRTVSGPDTATNGVVVRYP